MPHTVAQPEGGWRAGTRHVSSLSHLLLETFGLEYNQKSTTSSFWGEKRGKRKINNDPQQQAEYQPAYLIYVSQFASHVYYLELRWVQEHSSIFGFQKFELFLKSHPFGVERSLVYFTEMHKL